MDNSLERSSTRRPVLVGSGLAFVVGLGAALTNSSAGCIIPDECILVVTTGKDWCRYLGGAKMWPIGNPGAAVDVKDSEGGPPLGCVCFNSAEHQILDDGVPAGEYATLIADIEQAARDACDALVPSGYDHNCYLTGPNDPAPETPFPGDPGSCVGDCVYTDNCGDPSPYECECVVGESGCNVGETGGETGETGSGDLDSGRYISCVGNECDVDEAFAQGIYDDPSVLLGESTRLVYDSTAARFVFASVGTDSVADELGFQTADVLESVDGVVIDDLDAALEVFASSAAASSLRVRVLRGTQWVDFSFTFVN